MKILIAMHRIQDLGGIINHTEHLAAAFKELGHEVKLARLEYAPSVRQGRGVEHATVDYDVDSVFSTEQSPVKLSQKSGWTWGVDLSGGTVRIPYKGVENLAAWRRFAAEFDAVIWTVPVPSLPMRAKPGNTDWPELYKASTKHIGVIHDGNLPEGYPHIAKVAKHFHHLVAVHPCSMKGAALTGVPHTLIFNPQMPRHFKKPVSWQSRDVGSLIMMQTFKRWKRVDDVLRALPHCEDVHVLRLLGGGIEQRYMTSTSKQKPEYRGLWKSAQRAGMHYYGFVRESVRDTLLRSSRVFIDASWSAKYAARGSHFNRTFIEAMMMGCVPMARECMTDAALFKPREHYLPLPLADEGSRRIALAIDDALGCGWRFAAEIQQRNYDLVANHFDALEIAGRYCKIIRAKPRQHKPMSGLLKPASVRVWETHFRGH